MRQDTIYDNFEQLIDHGNSKLRKAALEIAEAGIKAVIPYSKTKSYLSFDGDRTFTIDGRQYRLADGARIFVVGVGKGSYPIAKALDEVFGDRIYKGFVIVKEGEKRRLDNIEIFESSHPFPDERSVIGALRIKDLCEEAGENDFVFAAVTGGSSALANLPAGNITIQDILATNKMLLQCGADIAKMNAVRKHLCNLKGGRVVQYSQPATVITFTFDTNTPGMPWPDLCLPDPTTFQDAVTVLKDFNLWDKVPDSVRERLKFGLSHPEEETLKSLDGTNHILFSCGNQLMACKAAAEKSRDLGYNPYILSSCIEGEAKDVGIVLAGISNEIIKSANPFKTPCALISGGETTITIVGNPLPGGPNQETVFGFVSKLRQQERVAFVCLDTDGTDGPTDLAGGIGDGYTKERMKELGISFNEVFSNHGTYEALEKLGDGVRTGHTGTNVMGLRVVVIE